MLNWDGFGVPPDAATYEEKTDGQFFWFVCLTCNGKGADKFHCTSDGHKAKLRAHLERQARASPVAAVTPAVVRPDATATTAVRLVMARPPPPPSGQASSSGPLPQHPTTQDFLETQETRIRELADTVDAMNKKLDTIMAALGRLSARPQQTGERAAASSAATAAASDAPAVAAAQQHYRGTWASAGPSTDASWSTDAATQPWRERTQWSASASTDTSAAATAWR